MKQNAFALLYANGLPVAEHTPVDGEGAVADFEAVWHALSKRGLHGGLADFLERLVCCRWRKKIHGHVAAVTERGLKFF